MPTKKKVSKKAAAKKTVQKKSAPEAARALIGQITSGPGGRPTLYKPQFCDEIIKYFDVEPYTVQIVLNEKTGNESHRKVANDYPTLAGFAKHIKVSRSVLQFWMQAHPEFLLAVLRAKAMGEHMLVVNTLHGLYEPRFAVLVGKNYTDLRDVKEILNLDPPAQPETPDEIQKRIDALGTKIERLRAQL